MNPAALPEREAERIAALRSYAVLDTPSESRFDDIARVVAHLCDVPIALVSLVDEDRQWFKARVGLAVSETPRDLAFCAHAILSDDLFVIEDARDDPRFADNPLVLGGPQIRFYAGAPLAVQGGHRLGTLCAIDDRPRGLDGRQRESLIALARHVVELFELRRVSAELAEALARVRTLGELIPICSHCRKVRDDRDYWSSLEHFVGSHSGSRFSHGICPDCVREHFPEHAEEALSEVD
ncbi:GAF domain-containing protein [Nannocystaceae bacterium ST9]